MSGTEYLGQADSALEDYTREHLSKGFDLAKDVIPLK